MRNKVKLTAKQERLKRAIQPLVESILREDGSGYNYYKSELNKIKIDSEYSPKLQINDGSTGAKTNWLSITRETLPVLIEWLQSIESQLPR